MEGSSEVIRLAREGLQTGAWQCAFVNNTPRFAKRSILGVRAWGCPPSTPTQSFRSSTEMRRMLGRDSAAWVVSVMRRVSRVGSSFFMGCIMLIGVGVVQGKSCLIRGR